MPVLFSNVHRNFATDTKNPVEKNHRSHLEGEYTRCRTPLFSTDMPPSIQLEVFLPGRSHVADLHTTPLCPPVSDTRHLNTFLAERVASMTDTSRLYVPLLHSSSLLPWSYSLNKDVDCPSLSIGRWMAPRSSHGVGISSVTGGFRGVPNPSRQYYLHEVAKEHAIALCVPAYSITERKNQNLLTFDEGWMGLLDRMRRCGAVCEPVWPRPSLIQEKEACVMDVLDVMRVNPATTSTHAVDSHNSFITPSGPAQDFSPSRAHSAIVDDLESVTVLDSDAGEDTPYGANEEAAAGWTATSETPSTPLARRNASYPPWAASPGSSQPPLPIRLPLSAIVKDPSWLLPPDVVERLVCAVTTFVLGQYQLTSISPSQPCSTPPFWIAAFVHHEAVYSTLQSRLRENSLLAEALEQDQRVGASNPQEGVASVQHPFSSGIGATSYNQDDSSGNREACVSWPEWVPPLELSYTIFTSLHTAALTLVTDMLAAEQEYLTCIKNEPEMEAVPCEGPILLSNPSLARFLSFTKDCFGKSEEDKLYRVFVKSFDAGNHSSVDTFHTRTSSSAPLKASHLSRYDQVSNGSPKILYQMLIVEEAEMKAKLEGLGMPMPTAENGEASFSINTDERYEKQREIQRRLTALDMSKKQLEKTEEGMIFPLVSTAASPNPVLPQNPLTKTNRAPMSSFEFPSLIEMVHYFALLWLQRLVPAVYERWESHYFSLSTEVEEGVPSSHKPFPAENRSMHSDSYSPAFWWQTALPWTSRITRWRWWWNRTPPSALHRGCAYAVRVKKVLDEPSFEPTFEALRLAAVPLSAFITRTTAGLLSTFIMDGMNDASSSLSTLVVEETAFLLQWIPLVSEKNLWENELKHLWNSCIESNSKLASVCFSDGVLHSATGSLEKVHELAFRRGIRLVVSVLVWLSRRHVPTLSDTIIEEGSEQQSDNEKQPFISSCPPFGRTLWREYLWTFFTAYEVRGGRLLSEAKPTTHNTGSTAEEEALYSDSVEESGLRVAELFLTTIWLALREIRTLTSRGRRSERKRRRSSEETRSVTNSKYSGRGGARERRILRQECEQSSCVASSVANEWEVKSSLWEGSEALEKVYSECIASSVTFQRGEDGDRGTIPQDTVQLLCESGSIAYGDGYPHPRCAQALRRHSAVQAVRKHDIRYVGVLVNAFIGDLVPREPNLPWRTPFVAFSAASRSFQVLEQHKNIEVRLSQFFPTTESLDASMGGLATVLSLRCLGECNRPTVFGEDLHVRSYVWQEPEHCLDTLSAETVAANGERRFYQCGVQEGIRSPDSSLCLFSSTSRSTFRSSGEDEQRNTISVGDRSIEEINRSFHSLPSLGSSCSNLS